MIFFNTIKKSLMDSVSMLILFNYFQAFSTSFKLPTYTYYLILHRPPYYLFQPSARVVSLFFLDSGRSLIFSELFLIMECSSFLLPLKINQGFLSPCCFFLVLLNSFSALLLYFFIPHRSLSSSLQDLHAILTIAST